MNAIESISKGGASRRKSVAALACVLALAMVACAVVTVLPGDENYEVEAVPIPVGGDLDTFPEGQALVPGIYALEAGEHTVKLNGNANYTASTGQSSTPADAIIILKPGAILTMAQDAGTTDTVKIYVATESNTYIESGVVVKTIDTVTEGVTVTVTATDYYDLSVSTDAYVGDSTTTSGTQGATLQIDNAGKGANVSIAENTVMKVVTGATTLNLGYVYSYAVAEDTENSVPAHSVLNGAAPAEPLMLYTPEAGSAPSYTVKSGTVDFVATVGTAPATEDITFSVTPGKESTGITVTYSTNDISITGNNKNDVILLTSGEYQKATASIPKGMIGAYSVADSTNTTIYAAIDDIVLDRTNTTATVYAGTTTVANGEGENASIVSVTVNKSAAGVVFTYNAEYVEIGNKYALDDDVDLELVQGKAYIASAEAANVPDFAYAYSMTATAGTTYSADVLDSAISVTTGSYSSVTVKKATDGGSVTGGTNAVAFDGAFSTDAGLVITASEFTLAGEIAGDVTVSGNVAVAAYSAATATSEAQGGLTVVSGTVTVADKATLSIAATALLVNNGTIAAAEPAEGAEAPVVATVAVTGSSDPSAQKVVFQNNGTIDVAGLTFTVENDIGAIDGVEYAYAELSGTTYTLKADFGEEDQIALASGKTVVISAAPANGLTVTIEYGEGEDKVSRNIQFSADFSGEVTVANESNAMVVSGTVSEGRLTVMAGNRVLGDDADALVIESELVVAAGVTFGTDSSPVILDVAETGTVTIEGSGDDKVADGLLVVKSGTGLSNEGTIINEGTFRVNGSTAFVNDGIITNNGVIAASASGSIANNGTINDNSTGTYTGGVKIANAGEGQIVVASDKADALAVAGAVSAGKVVSAGGNWTYETGKGLALTGAVTGQYFAKAGAVTVAGDITVTLADAENSIFTGVTTIEAADPKVESSLTVELALPAGTETQTVYAIASDVDVDGINLYVTGGINTTDAVSVSGTTKVPVTVEIDAITGGAVTIEFADATIGAIDVTGAVSFKTDASTEAAVSIAKGIETTSTVQIGVDTVVGEGIAATGNVTVTADLTVNDGISGATVAFNGATGTVDGGITATGITFQNANIVIYTGVTIDKITSVNGSNLDIRLYASDESYAMAITGTDSPIKDANSVIITEGLKTSITNPVGAIIVKGGDFEYSGNTFQIGTNNYVRDGISQNVRADQIYLYGVGDILGIAEVLDATQPIADGMEVYNTLSEVMASTGTDFFFVSLLTTIDFDGMTIDKNITISTNVVGDVTVAEGVTLVIAGNYGSDATDGAVEATVNGVLQVSGTLYGKVNGVEVQLSKAAYANVDGVLTISAATTKAVDGSITVAPGQTVVIAADTVLNGVAVNTITLSFTAVADVTFSVAAVEEPETPVDPEVPSEEETPVEEQSAVTNARAVPLAANAEEPETPALEMTGEIQLKGDIGSSTTPVDALIFNNATITVAEGSTATIYVKDLSLAGNIVLGEGVTIDVTGADYLLTVVSGANVSGAEKSIALGEGKIVVEENATVAEGVVNVTQDAGTTAANQEEFLSVLQFQDEVTLTQDITLTEGAFEAVNKTINLMGFKLTVDDGFTLTLGEGTDVVAGAKADGTAGTIDVTGTGKLVVGKADVFAVVTYEADANIDTTNAKVTDLSGDALPEQGVGFGSTLNIGADTVFSMTSKNSINVYGTLNVAGSLTVGSGAYIAVYSCGAMNVSGDITAVGDITVDGAAEIAGDMTVTGTLTVAETGEFSVPGTLNMNGTLVGAITYAGTVNIGTADVAGKVGGAAINMMDGALLNVVNSTGTVTITGVANVPEPGEGEVAPTEVVTSMTLAGVKGLTVTAEEYEYELVFKEMDLDLNIDAWVASLKVGGTMTAGTVTADGVLEIDGSLTVQAGSVVSDGYLFVDEANTLTVQAGASVTNNGVAVIDGTAAITAAITADAVLKGEGAVYASYYSVTAETGVTGTYAAFDVAVAEISGADGKKVTVYGMQVSSGAEVAEGTVVIDAGAYLFVEGTLVFAPAAGIDNSANATDPVDDVRNIVVAGTVTLNDSTVSKLVDADVEAEVIYGQAPVKNYTSLANAIASGQTEISLNDDVVVDGKLEIPEDITVKSEVYGFTVNAGGELLVNGSVQLTGADNGIVQMPAVPATGTEAAKEAGKITVDGMGYIYVPTTSPYFDSVGAYYLKNIAEADAEPEVVAVIATIDKAAADSANVYADNGVASIVVNGAVAADGPLSFTAPEGTKLVVGVVRDSGLTAESITLSENAAVSAVGGTVDADFVCGDSTLALDKATGTFAVAPVVPEEGAEAVLGITADAISGDITVAAGTVQVVAGVSLADADGSVLSIAQGTTLAVPAEAVLAVSSDDALNVAGTLEVAGTLKSFGDVTVTGTVTVTGSIAFYDALTVTGTVALADDAAETAEILVLGDAVVGEKPTALGGTSVGTMTGATVGTGGSIKAYAGTEVADIDGDSTVLNVRQKGTADYYGYMTVYVQKDADVKLTDFLYTEAFSLNGLDTGLAYPTPTQNTGLYKAGNWYSSSDLISNTALNDLNTVGDYAAVYAQVGLVEVSITVAQGNGLTVYIDGMPVSSLMGQGGSVSLTIGTHRVSYDVNAGYTDEKVTMTFNGQPVQNGEITIGTGSAGYVLSVTGAEASSGQVVTPEPPVVNVETNDEMTLTDYLLIVLVVLIVIMAIIVALRLMRS